MLRVNRILCDILATALEFATPVGGITEADSFRLNADINLVASGNTVLSSNWERVDTDGFDKIGTGLSESSGVYTFPSTGYYLINFSGSFYDASARSYIGLFLEVTLNNSTFSQTSGNYTAQSAGHYAASANSFIIKVTDTTNIKFRFAVDRSGDIQVVGATGSSFTSFTCIKLGAL